MVTERSEGSEFESQHLSITEVKVTPFASFTYCFAVGPLIGNLCRCYLHVPIDDFSVDLTVSNPPGDCGVGYRRRYAR